MDQASTIAVLGDFKHCAACAMSGACKAARRCTIEHRQALAGDDRVRRLAETTYDQGYEDAKRGRPNSNPHRK